MADQTRILTIAEDLFQRGEITNAEAYALVNAVEMADADEMKKKGGTFSLDGLLSLNGLLPRSLSIYASFQKNRDAQEAMAKASEERACQLEEASDQKQDR